MADERARWAIEDSFAYHDKGLSWTPYSVIIDRILKALDDAGLSIIDTRTHVAVAREDEAMVEAVARGLCAGVFDPDERDDLGVIRWTRYADSARAALAAVRAHAAKEG